VSKRSLVYLEIERKTVLQKQNTFQRLQLLMAPAALGLLLTTSPLSAGPKDSDKDIHTFKMVVSAGAKDCTPNASATVSIRPAGQIEIMDVAVEGLPPNTDFDFFVIQVPKAPFGVAWYQGDIQTNKHGRGHQEFVGRFSIETFAVAQGTAPAPVVFDSGPFPDASSNPPFEPVQMYHLGLWFDSPQAASAARCPATVTPFNGEHNAGLQALNTSNFADDHGPLLDVNPSAVKP
jgi:hypothetical protein